MSNEQTFSVQEITKLDFELFRPAIKEDSKLSIVRPSLSYWQDAFRRFVANKQSLFAFTLAHVLILFSFVGPFFWTIDPTYQDNTSPSTPPTLGRKAVIVGDAPTFEPKLAKLVETVPANSHTLISSVSNLRVISTPTTQRVLLEWDPNGVGGGYTVYRDEVEPLGDRWGVPVGDIATPQQFNFEDIQTLEDRLYYYTIVTKDFNGEETDKALTIPVQVLNAIDLESARTFVADAKLGAVIDLPAAPLGTDSLGRDILARLMSGGRVSLFIGVFASVLSVIFGIALGGVAGFFGGSIDTVLMRLTDLITGLPFLLFMILLKVVLNVGPGESGITALLISLVVLSWTGTARLVRGQILQLRNSEFVQAARMMGASSGYLIARHMLPNLIGVILVTLTFQIPSAIFTEAFLSFIGLGIAAPATSWGAMCNDAIQSLLTRPYEFFAPAIVISLTVLSFNLLGDGLRDALDPKLRSNE
ncbi:MAG: hypothetical protein RJB66_673 [Pseudomonadota bacterium]|jgi:oligopeptide transport system permease protein